MTQREAQEALCEALADDDDRSRERAPRKGSKAAVLAAQAADSRFTGRILGQLADPREEFADLVAMARARMGRK